MSVYLCRKCGAGFEKLVQYEKHMEKEACKEQPKITREEANRLARNYTNMADLLEALGLLKFDEPPRQQKIFEIRGSSTGVGSVDLQKLFGEYGTIRLEKWPEGLVLWVGGEIVWKSWEKKNIETSHNPNHGY